MIEYYNPIGKVVGITTQQYVYVASQNRKFRINEILIIEDSDIGPIKGEVIETQSFNRFIPLASEKSRMMDSNVLEGLRQVGYEIDNEETHVAKIRTLSELSYPITTGSEVRLPSFKEIEKLLIKNMQGWLIGLLRGTEEIERGMPDNIKNLSILYDIDKGVVPFCGVPFLFDYKSMSEYPHIGIFGGSGSGKSYALRVLLEEIMKKRIPSIVLDPHFEMEFRNMFSEMPPEYKVDFKDRYEVLTLGRDIGIPFTELSENDLVTILRSASQGFTDNMDNAVRTIYFKGETAESFKNKIDALIYTIDNAKQHKKEYEERDLATSSNKSLFEYRQRIYEQYGSEISNTAGIKGIQWRFGRLYRFGIFNNDIRAVLEGLKGRKLVVIRGSIQHLQIFSSFILQKTYGLRRGYKDAESQGTRNEEWFPPFLVVTDEAHNFAPKAIEIASKGVIKEIAQEGRKYGVFLVLASQRPALIDDTVIAQLNTKFVFRTVRGQDIKLLAEETDMTMEDTARLPYLPSGDAFVSSAITGRTVSIRVRAAITTSPNSTNPFDELDAEETISLNPLLNGLLENLPFDSSKTYEILKRIELTTGVKSSVNELKNLIEELVLQGKIKKEENVFGCKYIKV